MPAAGAVAAGAEACLAGTDKIKLEWLEACAQDHSYLSYFVADGIRCFQLLMKQRNVITGRCFDTEEQVGGTWHVQSLEVWRAEEAHAESRELFVYSVEQPGAIGMSHCVNDIDLVAARWTIWRRTPSDLDGCISLQQPQPLTWSGSMFSSQTPIVSLQHELARQGAVPHEGRCEHKPGGIQQYDCRNVAGQRCYLQAVIAKASIFSWLRGVLQWRITDILQAAPRRPEADS